MVSDHYIPRLGWGLSRLGGVVPFGWPQWRLYGPSRGLPSLGHVEAQLLLPARATTMVHSEQIPGIQGPPTETF